MIACVDCGASTPAIHAAYNAGLCADCREKPVETRDVVVNRPAFFMAAALVLMNVLLVLYAALVLDRYGANLASVAVDGALAIGLLMQRRGARLVNHRRIGQLDRRCDDLLEAERSVILQRHQNGIHHSGHQRRHQSGHRDHSFQPVGGSLLHFSGLQGPLAEQLGRRQLGHGADTGD